MVTNDPLYSKKHLLDSIKYEVEMRGNKVIPAGKTIFIGYDNKKNNLKKKEVQPDTIRHKQNNWMAFVQIDNHTPPFDKELILILLTVLFLSILGGWFTWKFYPVRLHKA